MKRIILIVLTAAAVLTLLSCGCTEPTEYPFTCTLSVSCEVLVDCEVLDINKRELVPEDGVIVARCTVGFNEGESVFDVLKRVCMDSRIHFEYSQTPLYGTAYIEGINNLYEFDAGPASGWVYTVNGVSPNIGSSSYTLSDGDVILWTYSLTGKEAN